MRCVGPLRRGHIHTPNRCRTGTARWIARTGNSPHDRKHRPFSFQADNSRKRMLGLPPRTFSAKEKPPRGQVPVTVNLPRGGQRQMYMPGIKSTLEADFHLRLDGTVDQTTLKHAPNKEIESAVREDIQNWVLNSPRSNAAPIGERRQTKIEVSCMAFPSNEEALCTLQAKRRPLEHE